jgi:hypothetical protein
VTFSAPDSESRHPAAHANERDVFRANLGKNLVNT